MCVCVCVFSVGMTFSLHFVFYVISYISALGANRRVQYAVQRYETVGRPSLCLSVRPSRHPATASRCGGFAAVGQAARRYRSIAARPALSSKCEQCVTLNLL